jgi:hypothetical protein
MIDTMLNIFAKDPGEKPANRAGCSSRATDLATTQIEKMIDPETSTDEGHSATAPSHQASVTVPRGPTRPAKETGEMIMNEVDLQAKLGTDGCIEIEAPNPEPRPVKGEHGHLFSIRGLVLAGAFIVTQDGHRTIFEPEEIFAIAHEHDE